MTLPKFNGIKISKLVATFTFLSLISLATFTFLIFSGALKEEAKASGITVNSFNQEVDVSNPSGIVNGNCTLGEAIIAANSNLAVDGCTAGAGSDTIFLQAGTYDLTNYTISIFGNIAFPSISGNLTIQGAGMNQTIIRRSNNAKTAIRGNTAPLFRFFYVNSGATTLSLNNLTLTGSYVNPGVNFSGGAILSNTNATVNLDGVKMSDNEGLTNTWGGAIRNNGGHLNVDNSIFENNLADGWGGAIFSDSLSDNISNSIFTNNSALNGGGGALVLNSRNAIASNNTFTDNCTQYIGQVTTVGDGFNVTFNNNIISSTLATCPGTLGKSGMMIFGNGTTNLNGNTIENNPQGGINIDPYSGSGTPTAITNINANIIRNNGGHGVLMYNSNSYTTITQSEIYNNVLSGINSCTGNFNATQNKVYGNLGNQIDLNCDGLTLNDPNDLDSGINNLLNYSILTSAKLSGGNLILEGFSRPGATIEFFKSDNFSNGFGGGTNFLISKVEGSVDDMDPTTGNYGPTINSLTVSTGALTENKFLFTIPVASLLSPISQSEFISTTSNLLSGPNLVTSEFGNNFQVIKEIENTDIDSVVCDTPKLINQNSNCTINLISGQNINTLYGSVQLQMSNGVTFLCAISNGAFICGFPSLDVGSNVGVFKPTNNASGSGLAFTTATNTTNVVVNNPITGGNIASASCIPNTGVVGYNTSCTANFSSNRSGTIGFSSGTGNCTTPSINPSDTAASCSFNTTTPSLSPFPVTATASGGGTAPSGSLTVNFPLILSSDITSSSCTPNTGLIGYNTTCTANFLAGFAGTIGFSSGTGNCTTPSINPSDTAASCSFNTTTPSLSPFPVTATASGGGSASSGSLTVNFPLILSSDITSSSCTPNTGLIGYNTTCTANFLAGRTGTLNFSSTTGSCSTASISSVATSASCNFNTTTASSNPFSVVVAASGGGNTGSGSLSVFNPVTALELSTVISCTPAITTINQNVNCTGTLPPGKTVTNLQVKVGTGPLANCNVSGQNITCNPANVGPNEGSYQITSFTTGLNPLNGAGVGNVKVQGVINGLIRTGGDLLFKYGFYGISLVLVLSLLMVSLRKVEFESVNVPTRRRKSKKKIKVLDLEKIKRHSKKEEELLEKDY